MDLLLKGKLAFVSGSTAGIGLAIARELAVEGATVVVNGRTQARVDEAVAAVRQAAADADVSGIAADLGTAEGVDHLAKQLPRVDILVNNLGIFEPRPFAEISDADWMRFFEVNVLSGVRLSRLYLPGMLERDWGRILFLSSESGLNTPVEMIHYGTTKTAQLAVSRGLAQLARGTGVTVNAVLPGPTMSEGVEQFVTELAQAGGGDRTTVEDEFFDRHRPTSLIRRFATTEEVAALVAYLCSPRASATTGAALRVDGGIVATIH